MKLSEIIDTYVIDKLSFKSGGTIFQEDSEAGSVFVVIKGKIRIKKGSAKGMVNVAALGVGDILGETSFFDTKACWRATTAVAETEVVLGKLDGERLGNELSELSPTLRDILSGLAGKLRLTTANAAGMAGS